MSLNGREALPDVQEALPNVPELWKALLDVRQLSGVPPDI